MSVPIDDSRTGGIVVHQSLSYSLMANFFTVVCTVLGAGLLSQPSNLMQSGWILGSLLIFGFAVAASYAIYGLCCVCVALKEENESWKCTYPNLGRKIYGRAGEITIIVAQNVTLLFVATIFNVLGGGELQQLFEENETWVMFPGNPEKGHAVWMVIFWFVAATPVIVLRGMKDLSIIGFIGGAASVIVGFCAVGAAISQPPSPTADTSTSLGPSSFHAVLASMAAISFSCKC